jgi:hydroxyacylglutathione hydrolase
LFTQVLEEAAQMLTTTLFSVGALSTNCYVLSCSDTFQSAIIDPGFESTYDANKIVSYITSNNLDLKLIINTHGHPDHTSGNQTIKNHFRVPICLHKKDAYMFGESGKETAEYFGFKTVSPKADILLEDEENIKFGNISLEVKHTPGHTPGSIILIGKKELFSGDTLFAGSIGRTDFPGSSNTQMDNSLKIIAKLPDPLIVYPGHGPRTTVGEEKRSNPFLTSF